MEKLLTKIEKYILFITVLLLPITVLSISSNPFVVPKLGILIFGVILAVIARSVRTIITGKLDFKVSNFDLPVLLISVAYILSSVLRSPNKMEAFLLPGTTTAVLGGALFYFLANQLSKEEKKIMSLVLLASASLFSLITLISFTKILSSISQLPALLRAEGFTPEGGYLPPLIFLLSVLPFGISSFITEKVSARKIFLGISSLIIGLGALISLYNILPGQKFTPRFPSNSVSWSITIDSLKSSPLFGVGPGNYLTAFNRFRPIEYNATDIWAIKFATAGNFVFTMITEAGLLAAAGFALLLVVLYRNAKRDLKEQKLVNWGFAAMADLIALGIIVLAFFVFPATILLLVLLFVYLSIYAKGKHTTLDLTAKGTTEGNVAVNEVATRFPALLLTIPVIVASGYLAFYASKVLVAEYKFVQSLNALARNDAQATYDTMREAIRINPYVDRYHATFARVNLALANSMAINATKDGATATDQDRQTITTLIQQAIAEGKSTVAVNPLRAGNWEILAQVYRSIMPLAQGADAFSVQSYRQAIALDPLNPNLRIALGGIYYAAKDYDTATSIFELAVATKPDHANARYNLAFALNEKGNLDRAINEMTAVLSLITDKNSEDFRVAQKALSDMQAKKTASGGSGEGLNAPKQAEENIIKPPLDLPQGSEPPEAPISPTPTIVPSPTGVPNQ